jgi:ABC-type sugar transport system ATPase subunit
MDDAKDQESFIKIKDVGQMDRLINMNYEMAIEADSVSVQYGAIKALQNISLKVRRGTIHALVGQNGAGKSTMLGVLAGRVRPTEGMVKIFGTELEISSPRSARAAGVAPIYQELTTIPALSAVANVFLGQSLHRMGILSEGEMTKRYLKHCERLGVKINPMAEVRSLSVADQQVLEIMRALEANARIILFDEPTASLAPTEREALFKLMRELRQSGTTLIFVSHNLEEVLDIADTVTVFKNGKLVDSKPKENWTKNTIVSSMLGDEMSDIYHRRKPKNWVVQTNAIEVNKLWLPGRVGPISFNVKVGEIVGIGGLVGSGRTSLLRALAGLEKFGEGTIKVNGREPIYPRSPRRSRDLGISLVPEDRKHQGLVLGMKSSENIAMSDFSKVSKHGVISEKKLLSESDNAASKFYFDKKRLIDPVGNLSGGNQQKALLARWGYNTPTILLVDEPTRGIDIGAKSQILDSLRSFADQGVAIIIVSSELEELTALADRVEVLAEGRHVRTIHDHDQGIQVSEILNAAFENH